MATDLGKCSLISTGGGDKFTVLSTHQYQRPQNQMCVSLSLLH